MSNKTEQGMTIVKEIHKDSLRKYVMLADDMFCRHNITDTKDVKGYLELQTVEVPEEKTETMVTQVTHATVLLVVDQLTVSMKLF